MDLGFCTVVFTIKDFKFVSEEGFGFGNVIDEHVGGNSGAEERGRGCLDCKIVPSILDMVQINFFQTLFVQ